MGILCSDANWEYRVIRGAIRLANTLFSLKKNVTYERYFFNTCVQDSRLFNDFLIDLHNKARTCEFGTLIRLIRDGVVCGIDSKDARGCLLRDTELTLDKAVNFMRAYETSTTQVNALENTHQTDSIHKQSIKFNNSKLVCYYCGSTHAKSTCLAYDQRCTHCGKLHHFARVCKSRSNRVDHIDHKACDHGQHLDIAELYIDHVTATDSSTNELLTQIRVNNHAITFKIDTGAQCNVIPYDVYLSIPKRTPLTNTATRLRSYGGNLHSCAWHMQHDS